MKKHFAWVDNSGGLSEIIPKYVFFFVYSCKTSFIAFITLILKIKQSLFLSTQNNIYRVKLILKHNPYEIQQLGIIVLKWILVFPKSS